MNHPSSQEAKPLGHDGAQSLFRAGAVVCALASLGLLLSLLTLVGDRVVREAIGAFGEARGVEIEVGQVGFRILDGVVLQDMTVRREISSELDVTIREVETGMGLVELLTGQRRPEHITVRGLRLSGELDEEELNALLGSKAKLASGNAPPPPERLKTSITLEDVEAQIGLSIRRDGVTLFDQVIHLTAFDGELTRGAGWHVVGQAELLLGNERRTLTFSSPSANVQHISFDGPLGFQLDQGANAATITFEAVAVDRAAGAISVDGISANVLAQTIGLDSLAYRGGLGTGLPPRLILRGLGWNESRGNVKVSAIDVAFASDVNAGIPRPLSVVVEGVELTNSDGRLSTALNQVAVALVDDPIARLKKGRWIGLAKSILVKGFDLQARLHRDELPSHGSKELANVLEENGQLSELFDGPLKLPIGDAALREFLNVPLVIQGGHFSLFSTHEDTRPTVTISGLNAHLEPVEAQGMMLSLKGLIENPNGQHGRVHANGYVAPSGHLRGMRGTIAGTHVASALSTLSPYVTVDRDAWIKLDFDYVFKAGLEAGHRVIGEVTVENFGFEAWRLSHTPIKRLSGRVAYDALLSPASRKLDLELSAIQVGDLMVRGHLQTTLRDGGRPLIEAKLMMPRQDCAKALKSVPAGLMPRLSGLEVSGELGFEADFKVDLADASTLTLNVDGDADSCRVLKLGTTLSFEELRGPFIHHPIEPKRGKRSDISVGRGTKQWVPSNQLPHFVKAAARVTEDRRFKKHNGVRWDLIEKAMRMNLNQEKFAYGGSTITQQLVKNLFLTREKTLSRKLEELIIAWEMERQFDKREILELYLNVIEFGPDLYGIRHASHHYFGKPPGHLSPAEAAFIMGLKPYPAGGHRQWASGRLNGWWVKRVRNILNSVRRREGAITQREFTSAAPYQVRFRKAGMSYWSGKRYLPPGSGQSADPGQVKGQ